MINKFYQWPPCNNCESLLPRAVLIHRICNMAYIDLQINNLALPAPGENFQKLLDKSVIALPYLEVDDRKYKTSREIWDYFVETAEPRIKQRLQKSDTFLTFLIQQWCNESFINSLIYARWKNEGNFQRFIKGIDFGTHANPESIDALRKITMRYLKKTPIGELTDTGFRKILSQQLMSLSKLIEDKTYFEDFAKYPTLTDLHVFMIIQGFLSPDLEESEYIEKNFPDLVRWYKEVNFNTQKERLTDFYNFKK